MGVWLFAVWGFRNGCLLPSRSENSRWTMRPWAITRVPFRIDAAACSPSSPHSVQRANHVSPSTHSLRCLSNLRSETAMVTDATALPACV